MRVYLAGSIAGGRKYEKYIELVSEKLESMGYVVMTKSNVVVVLPGYAKARTKEGRRAIMKRDKKWLRNADVFIAEVSQYSHGVGYEHCFAEENGKPVLLLRHKSLQKKLHSAFLDGTDYRKFMFSFYDEKNVGTILNKFFDKFFR